MRVINPIRTTIWEAIGLVVLFALCARLAAGGLPVQTVYPYATSILLDAGSRMQNGQVPYIDFHTQIGFSYLAMIKTAMAWSGGLPHALSLLSATGGVLIGALTWWLARARFAPPTPALLTLAIGLIAATPAMFGYGSLDLTYGGHYSRVGWALLSVIVVYAALPLRVEDGRKRQMGEGLAVGACLGLLLGVKFTFMLAAVGVLAVTWWYLKPSRIMLASLLVGFVIAIAVGLLVSGTSLYAYMRDCSSLAGSASLFSLMLEYRRKLDFLSLALLAAIAYWTWPAHRSGWQRSWSRPVPQAYALALALLGLGIGLSASTGIEDASPSYLLVGIALTATSSISDPSSMALRNARLIVAAMFCAFSIRLAIPVLKGPYAASSGAHRMALTDGPWRGLDLMPNVAGVDTKESVIPFVWVNHVNLVDNLWYLYLKDADRILRPRVAPGERVLSMDYINPFPYMLGQPAPRGDLLFWSFDRNVTPLTAPKPEMLFAEADWVMVPKLELFNRSSKQKLELYLDYIKANYQPPEHGDLWDCYSRKKR